MELTTVQLIKITAESNTTSAQSKITSTQPNTTYVQPNTTYVQPNTTSAHPNTTSSQPTSDQSTSTSAHLNITFAQLNMNENIVSPLIESWQEVQLTSPIKESIVLEYLNACSIFKNQMYINLRLTNKIMIISETMTTTRELLIEEIAVANKTIYTRDACLSNGRPAGGMAVIIDQEFDKLVRCRFISNRIVVIEIAQSCYYRRLSSCLYHKEE